MQQEIVGFRWRSLRPVALRLARSDDQLLSKLEAQESGAGVKLGRWDAASKAQTRDVALSFQRFSWTLLQTWNGVLFGLSAFLKKAESGILLRYSPINNNLSLTV